MYFSFVKICLMLLVCHLRLPAPFRIPSDSRPFLILSML